MPRYDFRCSVCTRIERDVILPITHTDKPKCCGMEMYYHITQAPMVSWTDPMIEPFRNPAAPKDSPDAVIMNTRQRREFMKKNDLVDANDLKPPTHEEQRAKVAEMQKSIEAITPTKEQSDRLRKSGLQDIV